MATPRHRSPVRSARRRSAAVPFVAAATAASAAFLLHLSPSAAAPPAANVVVDLEKGPGTVISDWGYDLKQADRAEQLTDARAKLLFKDLSMTVLRVPIYAREGHPRDGEVDLTAYKAHLDATKRALKARPSLKVYASIRLTPSTDQFPSWVLDRQGDLKTGEYGKLVAQYLKAWKDAGVTVDYVGLDNERAINKGGLEDPARYLKAAKAVVDNLARGVPRPKFVGPDTFAPDPGFLDGIDSKNGWSLLDVAGTHYYSDRRSDQRPDLEKFAKIAKDNKTPLWDTEFHWNTIGSTASVYPDAVAGLVAAFDTFDNGFTGHIWWSFAVPDEATANSRRGEGVLQSALVTSTTGAKPVSTSDQDGRGIGAGQLSTRAFVRGQQVFVWLINDTDQAVASQKVTVSGRSIATSATRSYTQWTKDGGDVEEAKGTATRARDGRSVSLELPARSLTLLTLKV